MANIHCNYYSDALKLNTDINVVIPTPNSDELMNHKDTGYWHEGARYQVLYLLHGTLDDRAMGVCHTNVSSMPITDERPELRMCPFLWHSWA